VKTRHARQISGLPLVYGGILDAASNQIHLLLQGKLPQKTINSSAIRLVCWHCLRQGDRTYPGKTQNRRNALSFEKPCAR
jgi:hypothetical protein